MQMILTGDLIDAEEAQRLGLVNEVTEEGRSDDRAVELAMLVARHSSKALGLAKDAVRAAEELPLSAGLERERRNIALAFTTRDQKEGMAAFFEKRPAEFTDE
jgi:enoyl-CoA hydratase/carnithine racemase